MANTSTALLLTMIVLAGAACSAREEAPAVNATKTSAVESANTPPITASATAPAPTTAPSAPAAGTSFIIDVKLSPAAAKKLADTHETIIVSADYNGLPAEGVPESDAPGGTIELGRQTVELIAAGPATFTTANANAEKLRLVKDQDVRVLINIFSGRRNSEDNILDCGIFDDSTRLAAQAPVPISCTLIGE